MATIFHLALASDWAAAQEAGAYTTSTRGLTLAEVGFIHASRADQWPRVRDAFFHDAEEPLLLLQIDTGRLDVPVVEEPGEPGSAETFPHVYGPIPLDAVVKAIPVPARATPARPTDGESFGRVFVTEMVVNMFLIVLVLTAATVGIAVGQSMGDRVAPLVGLGVGVVAGGVAARWIYVRRHGRPS